MPLIVFLLNKCASCVGDKDAIASPDITKTPFVSGLSKKRVAQWTIAIVF